MELASGSEQYIWKSRTKRQNGVHKYVGFWDRVPVITG